MGTRKRTIGERERKRYTATGYLDRESKKQYRMLVRLNSRVTKSIILSIKFPQGSTRGAFKMRWKFLYRVFFRNFDGEKISEIGQLLTEL